MRRPWPALLVLLATACLVAAVVQAEGVGAWLNGMVGAVIVKHPPR